AIGCVGLERARRFGNKREALEAGDTLIRGLKASPNELRRQGLSINQDGVVRSVHDLLGYPDITLERLAVLWPEITGIPADVVEQLEIEGRYAGYLERQQADILAFRRDESLVLPDDLDYASIGSLSNEIRLKLVQARPATLGAASRIPGVTPAALTALLGHVKKRIRPS
ncbi:MAG: tRNA uridine-5-carboxymethylaminomethyl(34) synthesis enzyme MnmG, partial [Rhodospirillales bacterium]|nr:tRNA uridine-5-carboxymethylaminomethyl(34) synthesis enzyme MnmG [Rhodospirillales bacterium]